MNLIQELLALQREQGYLSRAALEALARRTATPLHRLGELLSYYPHFRTTPPADVTIEVCRDVSCYLSGGHGLVQLVDAVLGQDTRYAIEEVSCLGYCDRAPAVAVNGVPVQLDDLEAFLEGLSKRLPTLERPTPRPWLTDPYGTAEDGSGEAGTEPYTAARRVLRAFKKGASRDAVVSELAEAGLRGMGGAGFPTGRKWELVRAAPGEPKYVICNADESEPGTFKDRVILEELPHLVIEGLIVDAFTVGASQGYIYLRHEYEAARLALEATLERARAHGALGKNIFDSGWDFDLEIFVSAGGYILGEETALLEAIEGKRGEPRNKPPFPGQSGLWGKPTLINNVETLALAPGILLEGADWWRAQGVGGQEGLKFMAVSGHVEQPGVYLVPMGTPIRALIELAGGVQGGRALKAFAPGGASSNWLPPSALDTPLGFATLDEAGSMLGSGALVVAAEGTPLLDLAANLVRFFRNESCGKCVPCRVGCEKAVTLIDDAIAKKAPLSAALIGQLDQLLGEASICGLGQVALNPLTSLAKHWPDEVPLVDGEVGP